MKAAHADAAGRILVRNARGKRLRLRPRQQAKALATALSALALVPAPGAFACPSYVSGKELGALPQGSRDEVRLFAVTQAEGGARTWVSLPVQVDPLDEGGVLRSDPKPGDAKDSRAARPLMTLPPEPTDRVALRREGFGLKLERADGSPCGAARAQRGPLRAVELKSPDGTYAYLVTCVGDGGKTRTPGPDPIAHDAAAQRIWGPRFEYAYQPNNQLMYKSMLAKHPSWPSALPAAADADLNLHLDIRKFFTIDFTNKDVESYVSGARLGPVGMVGSIDFFLRVLFFKVNLKMSTTAGFYADAAHIPTVVDVPRDAKKALNPGSGILYTWAPRTAKFNQDKPAETMPNADTEAILKGWQTAAATGLEYCTGDRCNYKLRGDIGSEAFGLDISMGKQMVEQGFYPAWVADVGAFKKAMGWDVEETDAGRLGVYFNNSGLSVGKYRFDQWIRVGDGGQLAATCPKPVDVTGVVDLGGDVAH
jgi:hypothetical protein